MSAGQWLGLNVTPLLLRVVLGVTFIWAGSAKLFYPMQVEGQAAATLANIGALDPGFPPTGSPEDVAPDTTPEEAPPSPAPPTEDASAEADPAAEPEQEAGEPEANAGARVLLAQNTPSLYTADQFPDEIPTSRAKGLVLLMHGASQPNDAGKAIWPAALAEPPVVTMLAWAAGVTELLGGVLILLGFFSRIWGIALFGTMVVACWLTQVGPATISGDAFLGFLPQPELKASDWTEIWKTFLWQFSLMGASLAIFIGGPGKISLDGLLFGKKKAEEDA
ncbi:MAG: DoxX family membrane protein [Planctomycetota bacterium]